MRVRRDGREGSRVQAKEAGGARRRVAGGGG